jgi:hypothetical protein
MFLHKVCHRSIAFKNQPLNVNFGYCHLYCFSANFIHLRDVLLTAQATGEIFAWSVYKQEKLWTFGDCFHGSAVTSIQPGPSRSFPHVSVNFIIHIQKLSLILFH